MTILLAIVLSALHLENDDLVTLYKRIHHFTYYFGTIYGRCAHLYCAVFVDEQYLLKLNSLSGFHILHVVYEEFLALFSLELLTVNLYDCVHFLVFKRVFPQGGYALCYRLTEPPRTKIGCKGTAFC